MRLSGRFLSLALACSLSLAPVSPLPYIAVAAGSSVKPAKTEAERQADGLGKDSSGAYRIVKEAVVVDEDSTLALGSDADIATARVTRGATLKLGTHAKIGTLELDDAASLLAPANAAIGTIKGTAGSISIGASSIVDLLSASVSDIAEISTKAAIATAYLRAGTIKISANAEIGGGTLYAYEHFEGGINRSFAGKLGIYGSPSADVEIAGRYCALGANDFVADPAVQTYPFTGLLGNVDPLLDATIEDGSDAFAQIRDTAESFDTQFEGGLRRLAETDASVAKTEDKLAVTTDPAESRDLGAELDNLALRRAAIETKLKTLLEDTFEALDPAIDADTRTQTLWIRTKDMYSLALDTGNPGQVYALCANSETTGNVGSVQVQAGKIHVGNRAIERISALSTEEADLVMAKIGHVSDGRLAEMQRRIDIAKTRIAAKRELSESDAKALNLLLDVETAIRNELLYH